MANSSVFGAIMAKISGHRGTETRRKILSLHWRIRFYCNIPGVRVRSPRLRARQEIRCAFWRERPSGLRPAGPLAVLLAPYIPQRVCSSLAPCQRAWGPAAKCTPYFLTGPKGAKGLTRTDPSCQLERTNGFVTQCAHEED